MRTKAQIIEKIYELNNSIINEYKSFTYLKSNSKNLKYLSLRELEEVELSLLDKIQELSFEKENEKFKISEEGIKIINLVFEIKSLLKNKLYLNRKNFINKIKLLFDSSVEIELFFEAKDLDIYLKELPDKRITLIGSCHNFVYNNDNGLYLRNWDEYKKLTTDELLLIEKGLRK